MEIKLIKEDASDRIYQADFSPSEFPLFDAWLSHLPENKVGVQVNGKFYRFSTAQEKACFTYGMGQALQFKPKQPFVFKMPDILSRFGTEIVWADRMAGAAWVAAKKKFNSLKEKL